MSRFALSIGVLTALFSVQAWALPQSSACRASGRGRVLVLWAPVCALSQDPWQDCDEDPWQLSSLAKPSEDRFSDPWQDDVDPWQPVLAVPEVTVDVSVDPWQPVVTRLTKAPAAPTSSDTGEDPWQPAFDDPWQDASDDPWQLP